jgi:hypothetical protein
LSSKPNIELCSTSTQDSLYNIEANSAAIYQSINYPIYPKTNVTCRKNITVTPGNFLKVYLNTGVFLGAIGIIRK